MPYTQAQSQHEKKKKNKAWTDSTIDLPQNHRSTLTDVSWLLDTTKDTLEKNISIHFLVCERLSIDDVGEGVEGHRISGDTTGSRF